jgi:hypothetical protein
MNQTVIDGVTIPAQWLDPLRDSFTEWQLKKPEVRRALLVLYLISEYDINRYIE